MFIYFFIVDNQGKRKETKNSKLYLFKKEISQILNQIKYSIRLEGQIADLSENKRDIYHLCCIVCLVLLFLLDNNKSLLLQTKIKGKRCETTTKYYIANFLLLLSFSFLLIYYNLIFLFLLSFKRSARTLNLKFIFRNLFCDEKKIFFHIFCQVGKSALVF